MPPYNVEDVITSKKVEKIAENDVEFGSLNTVKDIGYHLTTRMRNAMEISLADIDIGNNSPMVVAFPDGDSLYKEINEGRTTEDGDFYSENNTPLKYRSGDPGIASTVDYDSPGLAMGEANIINPDFQFNELDDVRSDFRRPYIGRLYSERIYDYNLPTVIFETGVLTLNIGLFSALAALTKDGSTADMSSYLRDPGNANFMKFAFQKVGAAIRSVLNFTVGGLLGGKRFYKFKSNTRIYMRFVNEMLIEVATWMDLAKLPILDLEAYDDRGGYDETTATALENSMESSDYADSDPEKGGSAEQIGEGEDSFSVPRSKGYAGLSKTLSVLNIIPGWRVGNIADKDNERSIGGVIKDSLVETSNMTAAVFIPFGLSKATQVSESFSNTTMEHPLMSDLKAKGNQVYQQSALGILGQGNDAINIVKNLFDENYTSAILTAGKSLVQSITKNGAFLGEAGMIMSGEGKFQLPSIWEDSGYSRNYSLNFENRSPYGHRLSIFENTMVQTIFLIGMTAPRQVGTSTYMSPFYVRAFSKGLFSVEVGMIEQLDITKGFDKNERTVQGFSRVINCDVRIKDVVPRLMVGLNAGIFGILSSKNVGFREYIAMFANVDLLDRTLIINRYRAFVNVLINKFSGENLMNDLKFALSQTLPFKMILKARTNFFGYRPPQMMSSVKPQSVY
jgi:hypothetical protein